MGPVELAAERSIVAAQLLGLIDPNVDATACAALRVTARAVDEAATPGAAAYAAAVLGRMLRDVGLDRKSINRALMDVDRAALDRAVAEQLAGPQLRAVEA